jgi:FMN phosphatase YigB (HAD superfamily)
MRIDPFFDVVVTFDDTRELKPSPKPFLVTLEKLNLNAQECLMVGDMAERDIMGAHSLGIKTCLAKYGGRPPNPEISADYEINDISELLNIMG